MTLLQLSYFISLAETLHYTKTAEMLHVSQPSLSYAISELEKDLGVKLFIREKQSIGLTEYGRNFYPYVKKALESLDDGRNILKAMSSHTKTVVRWGYFHSVSSSLIPALISGFQQTPESKNVSFQLMEDTVPSLLSRLQNGELDFCLTCHQENWTVSVAIAQQPLYLAVPKGHTLAEKKTVSFADFAQFPQIMLTPGSDLRVQIDRMFADNDVIPQIAFETRECNAALQYVALNFGVSVLPQVPVMDREILTIVPIIGNDKQELSRTIYLTYRRTHHLSPAAYCVIEYILSRFGIMEQPLQTGPSAGKTV